MWTKLHGNPSKGWFRQNRASPESGGFTDWKTNVALLYRAYWTTAHLEWPVSDAVKETGNVKSPLHWSKCPLFNSCRCSAPASRLPELMSAPSTHLLSVSCPPIGPVTPVGRCLVSRLAAFPLCITAPSHPIHCLPSCLWPQLLI